MKRSLIALCLALLMSTTGANATNWYAYCFRFDNFVHEFGQLQGSSYDNSATGQYFFDIGVTLSDYIADMQHSGRLEPKPMIYNWTGPIERDRFSIELYETKNAYYINANHRESYQANPYVFSLDELIRIVDYFACEEFEPFYCDKTLKQLRLAKELLFNKINTANPPTYFDENKDFQKVYSIDRWSVRWVRGDGYYVFWDDEKAGPKLYPPVIEPVKINDRLVVLDGAGQFVVMEQGRCIKQINIGAPPYDPRYHVDAPGISNSNDHIHVYRQWLNIYDNWSWEKKEYYECRFSYSYAKNRVYKIF